MKITDKELLKKAKFFGKNALMWKRKFMGLLPEISRRRLYELKGFSSIFEFSFKVCGLSEDQVRRVLCLEKRFEESPVLKNLLITGEVSVSKLSRIASIVSPENEEALAQAVKLLPKSAVETLVRDEKFSKIQNGNGLFKAQDGIKSVPGREELNLSPELTERLLSLQKKGLDLNQILNDLLDQREQAIQEEKARIVQEQEAERESRRTVKASRTIPVRIKKLLHQEHGNTCSIPYCKKPSEEIHHAQTFALSQAHNPHYLAPLCKDHHVIAHAINLKVQEKRAFG